MEKVDEVLCEVRAEMERAITIYPPFNSTHEGFAVIEEERDELWADIKANKGRDSCAMIEAIQLAAMATRYVCDLRDWRSHPRQVEPDRDW
jgi:hypothetical protein